MSTTTNLTTLKINYLTEAQYATAVANNQINEDEIYLTPETAGNVSITVSNATNGGLTVTGSPVASTGTVSIGHSNVLTNAQTTQAVYPIKIDKNGHISAYGSSVDTNKASSSDTSSKIFLIGATSQASSSTTYSHDTAYIGTDGCLYSNSTKVQTNITETSVTIATSSWNSSTLQASATVSGVTSSSKIWISPADSSYDVYAAAGVRGKSQTTNSVTFICSSVPTASVTINVAVAN